MTAVILSSWWLTLTLPAEPAWGDDASSDTLTVQSAATGARSAQTSAQTAEQTAEQKLYDGRTLADWQQRLKRIDPRDPDSRSDVPGMRALLNDTDVPWYTRRQAALTLGRMGDYAESAVPDLIHVLQTETRPRGKAQTDRSWAIKALAIYGDIAESATDELIRIANSPQSTFGERAACLEALSQIGVAHPDTLPALLDVLRDAERLPNLNVTERRFMALLAVEGLGVIGPGAAAAVPQLIQTTRADSSELRRLSAMTLGQIGPAADVAIPALVDLVFDDDSEAVRDAAAMALPKCGPRAPTALTLILHDDEVAQRLRGARAVGLYETLPESLLGPLEELLADPAPSVRVEAAGSLWRTTGATQRVLPVLLDALTESDRQVRLQAVRLFAEMETAVESVRAELETLSDDPRAHVRQAASKVLEHLELQQAASP